MFSGFVRQLPPGIAAVALVAAVVMSPDRIAAADPSQDQKFFDLLGQQEIPAVDNENSLVAVAKKACGKLDDGMPVGDLVELIRNNGFKDNPLARLEPQDRITRTINKFINASVEAYCPYNRGKIASIAAYRARPAGSGRLQLVSVVGPVHAGEIAPTKPLPVPAQPPPRPQEIQPPPQQLPPPSPRRVQPAPSQAPQQIEPPLTEAPPPIAEVPAAPAPGGSGGGEGGGDGGGSPSPAPTPDQPAPPGHVRLAP